jgi:hypothetical protein
VLASGRHARGAAGMVGVSARNAVKGRSEAEPRTARPEFAMRLAGKGGGRPSSLKALSVEKNMEGMP